MFVINSHYKYILPKVRSNPGNPLHIPEAEPGDVLEIFLDSLSPLITALGYAAVLTNGKSSAIHTGNFGGYLFPTALYPGTTLYLPVFIPGGSLMLSSPLLKDGQSELPNQTNWAKLIINVLRDFPLQRPRLENDFSWFFLASHTHSNQALNLAWHDLLTFLQFNCYCSRKKAKSLAAPFTQTTYHSTPGLSSTTVCLTLSKSTLRLKDGCNNRENHLR